MWDPSGYAADLASCNMAEADDLTTKQQAVLEAFFVSLGHFAYDKAREIAERERDAAHKIQPQNPIFCAVLTSLSQLAVSEKNYTSLIFLAPKGFLRKDSSLKLAYETLKNDFRRLEEQNLVNTPPLTPVVVATPPTGWSTPSSTPTLSSIASSPVSVGTSSSLGTTPPSHIDRSWVQVSLSYDAPTGLEVAEKLAGHLCGQLHHFVCARLDMMEFYEKMFAASAQHFMKFEDLVALLSEVVARNQKLFHHPTLSPLKSAFLFECESLLQLLEAQIHLQNWKFLPSLLRLHEAHSKLNTWATSASEGHKLSSYASILRSVPFPPLYYWLCKLKSMLISKFSLYFHEILSKQTTPQEMKSICARNSIDYYHKIVSFQRRSDALCVALVFDTHGSDDYQGHGYHHPGKPHEPPKGLDSYPAIVCCPQDKLHMSHWPSIIMIMNDKSRELNNGDGVVYFYDKQVQSTYFLSRVEPFLTLVVIFESRKSERDSYIMTFLADLCAQLRCNRVISQLKPGSR